jgi:hypothetical protein
MTAITGRTRGGIEWTPAFVDELDPKMYSTWSSAVKTWKPTKTWTKTTKPLSW